jgi:DNA-binding sugar fermentation-stimulating protein
MNVCELCKREVEVLTRHHLKPKARGGAKGMHVMVCLSCKDMIHRLIPNKELDREYDTLEKLLANKKVQKYVKWISNKKKERITIATKKKK